ncbi:MAG: hypothetical protein ACE5MI_04995 [Acidimicrobiia bacterium]
MDLNLVVLWGRLAAPPEPRQLDTGPRARYLLGVRSSIGSRPTLNVIPVTLLAPTEENLAARTGDGMWFSGSLQRQFTQTNGAGRSRLEVVAGSATRAMGEEQWLGGGGHGHS